MKTPVIIPAAAALLWGLSAGAVGAEELPYRGEGHIILAADQLQWTDFASLAPPAQMTVIEGDTNNCFDIRHVHGKFFWPESSARHLMRINLINVSGHGERICNSQLSTSLQAEYLQIQKTIEDFDARALSIKAWSVTFGMGALAGAFASHAPVVFLVASGATVFFWYLEATWKLFQLAYYERNEQIEKHFRNDQLLEHPFQISSAWFKAWSRLRAGNVFWVMMWPHIFLPHIFVVFGGLGLYLLARLGYIKL